MTVDFDSMTSSLHTILRVLHLHNFHPVPNRMDCVLPQLLWIVLLINQSFTDSSSEHKVASIPTKSFPEANKAESSGYKNSLYITAADMLFYIYIKEIIEAQV